MGGNGRYSLLLQFQLKAAHNIVLEFCSICCPWLTVHLGYLQRPIPTYNLSGSQAVLATLSAGADRADSTRRSSQ